MKLISNLKDVQSTSELVSENLKLLGLSLITAFIAMYIGSFLETMAVFIIKGRVIGNPLHYLLETPLNIYRYSVVGKVLAIISILPMLRLSQLYSLASLKELPILRSYPVIRLFYWLPVTICLYRQIMEPYYPATMLFVLSFVFYVGVVVLAVRLARSGLNAD